MIGMHENCSYGQLSPSNKAILASKHLLFSSSYDVRSLMACGLYNKTHFFSNLFKDLDLSKYIRHESMEEIIRFTISKADFITL